MFPAARGSDMHICPMMTPGPVPIPHVGGPSIPIPGTVLIGYLPAATLGHPSACAGPPDSIMKGSSSVFVNGKPLARMTDTTMHGGVIILGFPTVLVGG